MPVRNDELEQAHGFCSNNMPALKRDKVCGCFYCLEVFRPEEIEEYFVEDTACDRLGTAVCPYCGIDAILSESCGFPITKEFLRRMHHRWFT